MNDFFSEDSIFGQWIVDGWVRTFWSPGAHSLIFMMKDRISPTGYSTVHTVESSAPFSFTEAKNELRFYRSNNSIMDVVKRTREAQNKGSE